MIRVSDRVHEALGVGRRPPRIATLFGPLLDRVPVIFEYLARPNSISQTLRKLGNVDQAPQVVDVHATDIIGLRREIVLASLARDARFEGTLDSVAGQVVGAVVQAPVKKSLRLGKANGG